MRALGKTSEQYNRPSRHDGRALSTKHFACRTRVVPTRFKAEMQAKPPQLVHYVSTRSI